MNDFDVSCELRKGLFSLFINGASDLLMKIFSQRFNNNYLNMLY